MPNTLKRTYAFHLIITSCLLLSGSQMALAQTGQSRISVIPKPQELSATGETFRLDRSAHLTLADPKSTQDQFAAADFIDDLKETAAVTLRTGNSRRKAILIGRLDLPVMQSALKTAGVAVPGNLKDEGYVLAVGEAGVVVAGPSAAGVFYGL